MLNYFIVCPLVFLAGFVDAIAGGGGLIALPGYLMCGLPVHMAFGTNKMSSSMGTVVSTVKYIKNGFVEWKRALPCVIFAFLGSPIGANLALKVDERYFKIIMLVILPLTAFYVFKSKNLAKVEDEGEMNELARYIICFAAAFIIGMYDGFYGPGTGTFLLLTLTGLAKISLNEAAGTAKIINLSTNIAAFTVFVINHQVYYPLGIVAGVFSIAGHYLGAHFFTAKGAKFVKPVICVVLAIFFGKMIYELFIV